MTEQTFSALVEHYLGLETLEVTEELLSLCGSNLNTRALPILKLRLQEEEALMSKLEIRGYTRMAEKSQQLIASLIPLIAALEEQACDTTR